MSRGGFIKVALQSLRELFFPECCPVCGVKLSEGERFICMGCLADLPRLHVRGSDKMEGVNALFAGVEAVDDAVSMFSYDRLGSYSGILKDIKYRNRPQLGKELARIFAKELALRHFFNGLDCIVPVPLHHSKLENRGYNQSRYIADGVAEATGLPVRELLDAVKPHKSQTSKTAEARRKNVAGVFVSNNDLAGCNVLLVDDVITTGATLVACCDELERSGVGRIKILSLAFANHSIF